MNVLLLLLAIVPGIILSFLIIKADRFDKEPPWLMATAFVSGALITYPTMLVEGLAAHLDWDESRNFFKVFFFALLFVGLIEEFFKFICLSIPYFRKEFNEPLDGIVYAVLIAMGFATSENIMYADRFGLPTVALRAFTAVPAHGTFAIVMGYYVGLSKQDKKQRYTLILFGLGLSAFLHGVYDFFTLCRMADVSGYAGVSFLCLSGL
jgi:protease PrsW